MFAAGELGHLLSFPNTSFATLWPPAGVLVAALLGTPTRWWLGLMPAALAGAVASDLVHGTPLSASLWFVAGDAVEAVVLAGLFRRLISRRSDLGRSSEALAFCALALGVAAPLGALVGASGLARLDDLRPFGSNWMLWWAADGIGIVVMAPLWMARRLPLDDKERARWHVEGPLALVSLVVVSHVVFSTRTGGASELLKVPYLVMPLAIWLALRLRLRGAAAATLVVSLIAVWHTTRGHGPFVSEATPLAMRAAMLQGFLGVLTSTTLGLAASARERTVTEARLRLSEERLTQLFDGVHDLIQVTTPSGRFELVNRSWFQSLGYRRGELAGLTLDDIVEPASRDLCAGLVTRILRGEDVGVIELVLRTKDGRPLAVEGRASLRPADQPPVALRWVLRDITARKRLEERQAEETRRLERAYLDLAEIALSDPLTGLRNRRAFEEDLEREAPRADRDGAALSLLIVDVDHFKDFNDRFGHPAGDDALRAVARLLREHARRSDSVARIGGEEFAVILPDTDVEGALALAERFRDAIERHDWPDRPITVSIGVATVRGVKGDGAADLVRDADRALYRSKNRGRNVVTHSTDELVMPPTASA